MGNTDVRWMLAEFISLMGLPEKRPGSFVRQDFPTGGQELR